MFGGEIMKKITISLILCMILVIALVAVSASQPMTVETVESLKHTIHFANMPVSSAGRLGIQKDALKVDEESAMSFFFFGKVEPSILEAKKPQCDSSIPESQRVIVTTYDLILDKLSSHTTLEYIPLYVWNPPQSVGGVTTMGSPFRSPYSSLGQVAASIIYTTPAQVIWFYQSPIKGVHDTAGVSESGDADISFHSMALKCEDPTPNDEELYLISYEIDQRNDYSCVPKNDYISIYGAYIAARTALYSIPPLASGASDADQEARSEQVAAATQALETASQAFVDFLAGYHIGSDISEYDGRITPFVIPCAAETTTPPPDIPPDEEEH